MRFSKTFATMTVIAALWSAPVFADEIVVGFATAEFGLHDGL